MQSWEEEAVRSLEAHKSANLAYLVKFRDQGETLTKRRKEPDDWQQGLSSGVHTDAVRVFTHTLTCTRIHPVNLTYFNSEETEATGGSDSIKVTKLVQERK